MSTEHDSLTVDPRLETLLRGILAADDLQPAQNERVRAQLGLLATQPAGQATLTIPATRAQPATPEPEAAPLATPPHTRLRLQWLQFALAAVAFIAVGVLLALLFGSGGDDPESRPGLAASPEATVTVAPATATTGSQSPSVLPTPDEMGMYQGITLEQAQQIVSFEIAAPERIPDGLEPPGITVVESQSRTGRTYRIEMYFELAGNESPGQSVQFIQTSSPGSGEPNVPQAETTTTTINGIAMNRTTGANAGGDPLLDYWWEHDGIKYQLLAAPEGDLTPGLVERLMLSIVVPPGPTAEEATARLEQERYEMMPFPIPDTCAASDWAGPDFRVGQQYPTAYYLDGDGLSLWTTHGLLFAGENTITWLADAPLTTSEALSGPKTIHAVRTDADGATSEIPIDITEQIYNVRDTERAWWSTVNFPSEGCWEIDVSLGVHTLSATVYVYPQPPSGEFPQIDGAVMVDATQLDSDDLPFAASDAVGMIHVVANNPIEVNSYYSVPTQALREAGWSGGGFLTQQYASYSGWANGNRIVLFIVIPGGAQHVFADEVGAIDLGPFPDALDTVGDSEVLIYTRTAQCEEATPDDCMRKAFEAVNGPSGRP